MSLTTAIFSNMSERSSTAILCRLCMLKNHSNFNIFTSKVASQMTVEDALHDLIGLRVAAGDGLPTTICPQCLKKLMEFCDFKKICYESDSEMRILLSRNYCRSIQGEGSADDELESRDETNDCIRDATEGSSQLKCSVQKTEIYIPVQDCQSPRANMLFSMKEEIEDDFDEGHNPVLRTTDPSGTSSDARDPLANDDLSIKEEKTADEMSGSSAETKEFIGDSSEGTSMFACSVQRTEIYIPLEDCQLPQEIMMSIKEELTDDDNAESCAENIECIQEMTEGTSPIACSAQSTEIFNPVQDFQLPRVNIMPMFTEDGKLVDNSKMTNDSMTEATGLSTSGKTLLEKALTSCMLKERNATIDLSYDCIVPSVSETHTQSKTVASRAGEGGNVIDEELEEDSALHADKTRSNSIPDDGQSNIEHSPDYFCSACNRSFAHKGSLKCHMQRKHGVIESHSCRICGETFTKISYLNEHMHSHKGVKRFACNECTMSFSKKSILNLHMRTHTGEKPYSCKLCSRNFAHSSSLKAHMLVHSNVRPFPCNECAKAFYTKRDLMVHLRTHTAEKPFECSLCGKSFSAKNTLVLHLRTHTGEKPYSCDKCNKRFSGNSILKKHMRTHTKEFVCNYCGESFSRKDRYFVHMCSHTEEII
ncbi:zinc finger protein 674-like isoform X2 [Ischnura elegans]|uniref:zinc finger protein 674-like isoform X2 n=1 Tax=Ischnura elegans TaxID=197161 RepID=UPI001ED89C6A|nr:zinc finger protein 674-like isoform X2 [Ischnura elegans]